ncbi:iron ABC transporter permease [Salinibacterium sp. ZJ450]|uniref:ABC transporter permease n=1 Tax=Salinibacterium sp. ZJ450 TaxID=2708338 RepID=UPI001CD78829|nr:iron ABC transporter permease [Salinibacterium sp. ZJ450]
MRRPSASILLVIAALLILVILVGLPILLVAFAAVSNTLPRPGNISLGNIDFGALGAVLSGKTLGAAGNSLLAATGACLLALLIGASLALLLARTNIRGKPFLYLVGLSPMFLPSFVAALAWSVLAGPSGLLNALLGDLGLPPLVNVYSMPGLIFILGIYYSPYVFLMVHSALVLMNPDLEEAALVHGATLRTTIRKVTLSLMTPAILGSMILVFTLSVENFPVSQFIATPAGIDTLPTFIYRLMSSSPVRGNEAAAVAVLLIAIVGVVVLLQRRYLARRSYATVGGKGLKAKEMSLGKWRPFVFALVLGYFIVSMVLPLAALLVISVYSSPYISSIVGMAEFGEFSFENLINLVTDRMVIDGAINSAIVSVGAAAIGTALCFVFAYLVYRTKTRGRMLIEYVSMAPLAVPAIVLGLGLLWTWLLLPVPIYGTLAVLVVAFLAAQMPQGFRGISSSILQFNPDLEDTAVMHGSSRTGAVTRITAPLLKVGVASTFVLLLMLSMRELTVPLFLYTTDTRLLSIVIFDNYENGAFQQAAGIGLIYTVLIAVLALVSSKLGSRDFGK